MPCELGQSRFRDNKHAANAPDVRVAQFAAIVENKKAMRVGRNGFAGTNYGQLTSHSKMDDEVKLRKTIGMRGASTKPDTNKFAQPRDS